MNLQKIEAKVYIEAYGCSANLADAEIIAGLLKNSGFTIEKTPSEAELNIIVSCTVKDATYQRMVTRVKNLTSLGKPMIVAGCMPKTSKDAILKLNPRASLIGPNSVDKIVAVAKRTLSGERVEELNGTYTKLLQPRVFRNPVVGIVQIASGCLSACSFCQVKIARGGLRSFDEHLILDEIRRFLRCGCREIWLTSQDNGCYGMDRGGSLADLLDKVSKIEGDFRVRVGMMNPTYIVRDIGRIVDVLKDVKFFKFLHIPVQSGCNDVLADMRREYTREDFLEIARKARQKIPTLTLSTDIIVGYPTEEEECFRNTISLLEEVKPDVVNISRFSPRPGTKAALLPQHPYEVVKRRSTILHRIVKAICLERNRIWLGWRGESLVDEKVKGARIARNPSYKPILISDDAELGSYLEVEVNGASAACLRGVVCQE
ncbi:MAG: tRNA (N(6)-L-threonylcarbamoyladenosine(37)-C(2))-methylthiotransferase [Nitrososphaerales archaeon]